MPPRIASGHQLLSPLNAHRDSTDTRWEKPLGDAQFEAKFPDCARNAVRPLSDASVGAALATITWLERVADARELLTPFGADAPMSD